jgi:hypothetical protein
VGLTTALRHAVTATESLPHRQNGDYFSTLLGKTWWEVVALEPERFLALRASYDLRGRPFDPREPRPRFFTDSTWAWLLEELPGGRTRVVESGYWAFEPRRLQPIIGFLFLDLEHWVMQTRQFANLKRLAEGAAASPEAAASSEVPAATETVETPQPTFAQ